ncbi:hypothetical protein TrCOL_g6067 [Triparma columacea]|uniref:Riboflavin synthase n=1 Tax=Triparma columacea TaxID=722753 RepID=A0A9W7L5N2_9STRA|nr:hypothetical protein TrCOL_g6067 [Triparma columacea]
MFTGIIEEMGTVVSLITRPDMEMWDGTIGSGTELTIKDCPVSLDGAYLGCSICVSGVCLTATDLGKEGEFKVGLAPETLRRSTLGTLVPGENVNLERASEIGGRNSGHNVQGHVDGKGEIIDKWVDSDSLFIKIKASPEIMKFIVPKGFIAIDGTSLTICDVNHAEGWFTFMLIEYTQKKIIVPKKEVGMFVNLEVDVLMKGAESAMAAIKPRIDELERQVEELRAEISALKG